MDRLYCWLLDYQDRFDGWWRHARRRLRVWRCGLHGHADTLVFTSRRVYLHCAVCSRNTEGWDCSITNLRLQGSVADVHHGV